MFKLTEGIWKPQNLLKEGQEPFKLHSVNPKFPKNSFGNFGKGYIPNQNFGTFLRNYLVSEFKTIFYSNLKIYSNIYMDMFLNAL